MIHLMLPHVRALTRAHFRLLRAMPPDRVCDAWSLASRFTTLYELEARGLIKQGRRGWLDATLTESGCVLRSQLNILPDYQEAAE